MAKPKVPPASSVAMIPPTKRFFDSLTKEPNPGVKNKCDWVECPFDATHALGDGTFLCSYHYSEYLSNNNTLQTGFKKD